MAEGVVERATRVRVPAKINLALAVGERAEDGYHPLATVFHAVSLFDEVLALPAAQGSFSVATSGIEVGDDETHLGLRAARLLARRYGDRRCGVALEVRKAIPVAGGMAGGSADAAGALLACADLWDLDVSPDEMGDLAAELGSDVPFALLGGTAVGTGRGERLVPGLSRGTYHWVLGLAFGGLSTPEVYRRFDELSEGSSRPEPSVDPEVLAALAAGDPHRLGAVLRNDLEPAALDLRPDLRRTLQAGRELGAVGAVVSGSGPTCAFLAADESAAIDLGNGLTRSGTCVAVRRVTGPAPGARLVG